MALGMPWAGQVKGTLGGWGMVCLVISLFLQYPGVHSKCYFQAQAPCTMMGSITPWVSLGSARTVSTAPVCILSVWAAVTHPNIPSTFQLSVRFGRRQEPASSPWCKNPTLGFPAKEVDLTQSGFSKYPCSWGSCSPLQLTFLLTAHCCCHFQGNH